ncbi:hypothetical protein [Kiloniella sp.]|uniref:hypothetical protein n=1 Tax=Kiloniella sp. TaxID=1938587 RepID=UPI003B01AF17
MGPLKTLKRLLQNQLAQSNARLELYAERQIILQAQYLITNHKHLNKLTKLQDVEFCAFSQWGEDGIINWLVDQLPEIEPTFVEFGVGDYRESNTRLLLQLRNWRGLVIDGSSEHISDIQGQELYWRHDLEAKQAFITKDNINQLISEAGFTDEIGLLSVDIDGNDYWVWKAIDTISPAIVVCEYNAVFGDKHQLTVPYRKDFLRSKAHHSHLYFGASLPAMISLGEEKGYKFVGTTSSGCNAFFVREDLADNILRSIDGIWTFPSTAREARDAEGKLLFLGGTKRVELIKHLPIVDLEMNSNHEKKLPTLNAKGELYSENWRSGKGELIEDFL